MTLTSKPLNKQKGGSYIKDPKSGKVTLVEQTKQQKVSRLDEPDITKTAQQTKQQTKQQSRPHNKQQTSKEK